jgi:hypothetical protein
VLRQLKGAWSSYSAPPAGEGRRATNGCGFDGGEGEGGGGDGGGVRAWAGWVAGGGWVEGLQQT